MRRKGTHHLYRIDREANMVLLELPLKETENGKAK